MTTLPWQHQDDLTTEQVQSILERNLPNLTVNHIQPLGQGWDNTTWLVNGQWAFRLPRHEDGAITIRNEISLLPHLPNLQVATPKPEWICTTPQDYPYPFYGHAFLPGQTADCCALTDAARTALAAPLAQFLKTLHQTPIKPLQKLGVTYDRINRLSPKDRLPKARNRLIYLEQHQLITTAKPYINYFQQHVELAVPPQQVLGHGDFYARHIVLNTEHELTAVIDWGDSELMHPAVDLAIVYQFLPQTAHDAFWHIYGEVDPIVHTLSQLRAIYHAASMAWYAHQVQDNALLQEALLGLELLEHTTCI